MCVLACKMPEQLLIHRGALLLAVICQQPVMSWCMFKSAFSAVKNGKNLSVTDRKLS